MKKVCGSRSKEKGAGIVLFLECTYMPTDI